MVVILDALTDLGFAKDAAEIEQKWRMLLKIGGYKPNADFTRCFDLQLLRRIALDAVVAYTAIGCFNAHSQAAHAPIYCALNEGWAIFWADPDGYPAWEKAKVTTLFP
jgi:hypothetical protein